MLSLKNANNSIYLAVIFGLLLNSAVAADQQRSFVLSHVDHPLMESYLVPLIKRVYAKVNIEVETEVQPSKRNIKLITSGKLDGDVAVSEVLIANNDQIVRVGPSLLTSKFILLCHRTLVCNGEVLSKRRVSIAMTDSSMEALEHWTRRSFSRKAYKINRLSSIPKLVDSGKIRYGIYIVTENYSVQDNYPNTISYELFESDTYHVLNIKHLELVTPVSRALVEVLREDAGKID